jgi:hypothetical protein
MKENKRQARWDFVDFWDFRRFMGMGWI